MQIEFEPNISQNADGLVLMAIHYQGDMGLQETYYSVGGGFVLSEAEMDVWHQTPAYAASPIFLEQHKKCFKWRKHPANPPHI